MDLVFVKCGVVKEDNTVNWAFTAGKVDVPCTLGVNRVTRWAYFSTPAENPCPYVKDQVVTINEDQYDLVDIGTKGSILIFAK